MKIIILSRSEYIYSTARLLEEAEDCGHDIEMIDPLRCKLLMQEKSPQVLIEGDDLGKIDAIIPRIGTTFTHYGAAVIRQYEMMNIFTTLNSNALLRSRDKLRSLQLLSREGINFPKTLYFSPDIEWNIEEIIDYMGGTPIVVKTLEGTQGLGVMLLDSKMAAISTIEALQGLKTKFIVQEFIEEAKGVDIRVFIINNKVVAAMQRNGKTGDFRSNIHRGGTGELVKLTPKEEAVALKACRTMGLKIAGVDLIRSKRGPLILEVNSSPGLEGIEGVTDINIAREIIKYVEFGVNNHPLKFNRNNG
ncbi:30S ribosomal protein S6--L-glutamate ligase [Weeksellaceae bacterium TAE3-ERU29]|nr:30S ribosomal protein S6--L-glutamate ligase [Weeksellaceae bacterium TAE3-ERU29]